MKLPNSNNIAIMLLPAIGVIYCIIYIALGDNRGLYNFCVAAIFLILFISFIKLYYYCMETIKDSQPVINLKVYFKSNSRLCRKLFYCIVGLSNFIYCYEAHLILYPGMKRGAVSFVFPPEIIAFIIVYIITAFFLLNISSKLHAVGFEDFYHSKMIGAIGRAIILLPAWLLLLGIVCIKFWA